MKSSKLVTYLTEVARYQLRIQIAREILAHNMNFSPAWLLAAMRQKRENNQQRQNTINITKLILLFQLIGLKCENSQAVLIFDYFDKGSRGVIKNQDFVQFLLPIIKDGLRKAVIKRPPQDVQFTFELKHALKRIFLQILKTKSELKLYEGQFGAHMHKYSESEFPTKQQIGQFLQKFGKYPTDSELTLLTTFIMQGKAKQVPTNQISAIISESSKQIQYLAHNPGVLNQKAENQFINLKVKEIEGAREVEKILEKGELQHAYNRRLFPRLGTFGSHQNQFVPKQPQRKAEVSQNEIQTPITTKLNLTTPKSSENSLKDVPQQFPYPGMKIQRTNSIIQNEQKSLSSQQLRRAEKIADKLLTNQNHRQKQKQATPFRRLQQNPQNHTIYYPSKKKSNQPSQQSQSDYNQLLNTNLELEEEIEKHKAENKARIRQAKEYLKYDGAY